MLVLLDTVEAQEIQKYTIWLLQLQVKAKSFQKEVFIVQNCVSPFPIFFALFIHHQVGLFLSHPATSHHQLPHFSVVFFDFGRQKESSGRD
jgi:hypothetical protein